MYATQCGLASDDLHIFNQMVKHFGQYNITSYVIEHIDKDTVRVGMNVKGFDI
jgi:hypothetical protein